MTINEETQRKLSQDLPSGAVKTREQGGSKVDYIDGHFAMTRANEVFGHDGWSYSTRSVDEVYRGTKPGRDGENVVIVYEAIVCVSALGCTREDVGIGQCDSSLRNLGQAIEKGRKEAVTDAVKRALRSFGASFGLALYDKTKADVGASFAAQEAFDALDNAHDAAALDKARGVVKSLWESLSDAERETAAEKRDKAAKRIEKAQRSANTTAPATTAQEPPQRSANPMEGRGIEDQRRRPQTAAETPAPADIAQPVAAPPKPSDITDAQAEFLDGFYKRVAEIELPGECVAVWLKHRVDVSTLPARERENSWKAIVSRCEEVGKMRNAKLWLKKAIAEEDERRNEESGQKPTTKRAKTLDTLTDAPAAPVATEVTP